MGGMGGVIAVDASGAVALEFNTSAMYRAVRTGDGRREIGIFR
jgi:beta-aspartyl-peptidase (threonine type)